MSDNIDPDAVWAAMQADLSRSRQEELPLSTTERRGPSFAPGGRNGTSHIPIKTKDSLATSWGAAAIDDDESKQIEGLSNEDARPWARKTTTDWIQQHPAQSTPSRLSQAGQRSYQRHAQKSTQKPASKPTQGHPRRPVKPMATAPTQARHQLSSIDARRTSAKNDENRAQEIERKRKITEIAAMRVKAKLAETAAVEAKARHDAAAPAPARTAKPVTSPLEPRQSDSATSSAVQSSQTTASPHTVIPIESHDEVKHTRQVSQDAAVYLIVKGFCRVLSAPEVFRAVYTVELDLSTNQGIFNLVAPGPGERAHSVSDLQFLCPGGPVFMIRCQDDKGKSSYKLELANEKEAIELKDHLEALQAAIRNEDGGNGRKGGSVLCNDLDPLKPELHLQETPKAHAEAPGEGDTRTSVNAEALAVKPVGRTDQLIDISEEEMENEPQPSQFRMTLSNAVPHLLDLVEQILPEIGQISDEASSEALKGIREGITDSWINQGYFSPDDELGQDYAQFFDLMVQVRFKEYFHHLSQSPNGMALAGLSTENAAAPTQETTKPTPTTAQAVQTPKQSTNPVQKTTESTESVQITRPDQLVNPVQPVGAATETLQQPAQVAGEPMQLESDEHLLSFRYTPGDMMNLKPKQTPPPKGLQADKIPVLDASKKPEAALDTPKQSTKRAISFAGHKEWLNGGEATKVRKIERGDVTMSDAASDSNQKAIPGPAGLVGISSDTTAQESASSVNTLASQTVAPEPASLGHASTGNTILDESVARGSTLSLGTLTNQTVEVGGSQNRETRGIAHSMWATPRGASDASSHGFGALQQPVTPSQSQMARTDQTGPTSAPPAQPAFTIPTSTRTGHASPAAKGLSHSRFATKASNFAGRFTGAR